MGFHSYALRASRGMGANKPRSTSITLLLHDIINRAIQVVSEHLLTNCGQISTVCSRDNARNLFMNICPISSGAKGRDCGLQRHGYDHYLCRIIAPGDHRD